jgi:dual oxidase maturation factor 1
MDNKSKLIFFSFSYFFIHSALPMHNRSGQIDFNERFHWTYPKQMEREYNAALQKGLPYPILTVAEYFALDAEGFCWGRMYRQAGYYAHIMLW